MDPINGGWRDSRPPASAIQYSYTTCGGHPTFCSPDRRFATVLPIGGLRLAVGPGCELGDVLAVSATLIATPARICDLASGSSWPLPGGVVAARLAGASAALGLSDGSLVVEDWRSGQVLYSEPSAVTATAPSFPGVDGRGFDVQAEGTIVFTEFGQDLAWASVADPRPHVFLKAASDAQPVALSAPVRIAEGLVAVAAPSCMP